MTRLLTACCTIVAALLLILFSAADVRAQSGSIAGTLVDAETGETLIGANVLIEGTSIGSTTDLDGRYSIRNIEPGSHVVVFSYIGYRSRTIVDVRVEPGETTDLALEPEAIGMAEVVVEARVVENTEALLLRQRQRAAAVSDAVSAEAIRRSGSTTAADAMEQVTGASVVDGRYVYVRGLGERYVNTQLNGAVMPSADPDRNAVPLDLFPAGFLQHIVTTKTFTPDQPGSFTGGSINLETNTYPEETTLSFSSSTGFNSSVGWGGDVLLFDGGSLGAFGAGERRFDVSDLTTRFENGRFPRPGTQLSAEEAQSLDAISKRFSPVMAPEMTSVLPNAGFDLSGGTRFDLFGRPFGVIAGVTYDREASGYDDGLSAFYSLVGRRDEAGSLTPRYVLERDVKGSQEVRLGGMTRLAYKPHDRHELGLGLIRSRSDEAAARYLSGDTFRQLINEGENKWYEARSIQITERDISSLQIEGDHALGLFGMRAEWNASIASMTQYEPDARFFSNDFLIVNGDTTYGINTNAYDEPSRYFRDLEETTRQARLDLTLPLGAAAGSWRLKVGGSHSDADRTFREHLFQVKVDVNARYSEAGILRYDGDPASYFRQAGLRDTARIGARSFPVFGTYIDPLGVSGSYDGRRRISAGYGMLDGRFNSHLRFVGGLRVERTLQEIESAVRDTANTIDRTTLLPSAGLIFTPAADVNIRVAYGRTLARATFREMAPYTSFDFIGGVHESGNPALELTTVNNLDLRGEWFPQPGEIAAVSFFYKGFANPIERTFVAVASGSVPEITYRNVPGASVFGFELELRRSLDRLAPLLRRLSLMRHFDVGANLTITRSAVEIDELELLEIRRQDPDLRDDTRPMQGQPPYVLNLDLAYDESDAGTAVALHYNIVGRRLSDVVRGAAPDIYQLPRHELDLTASQQITSGLALKLKIHNLLDEAVVFAQRFKASTMKPGATVPAAPSVSA